MAGEKDSSSGKAAGPTCVDGGRTGYVGRVSQREERAWEGAWPLLWEGPTERVLQPIGHTVCSLGPHCQSFLGTSGEEDSPTWLL